MLSNTWTIFFLRAVLFCLMASLYAEEPAIKREDVYDSSGLLTEENYSRDGKEWQSIQFFYNEDGQLSSSDLFEDGLLKERTTYLYKEDGSLWQAIKNSQLSFYTNNMIISQLPDGLKTMALNRGLLVAINSYNHKNLADKSSFFYKDDHLVMARFIDGLNRLDEQYNNKGQRIKALYFYDDALTEQFAYTYNDKGFLSEEHYIVGLKEVKLLRYFYDDEGNLQQIDQYRGSNLYQKTIYHGTEREERYYKLGIMVFSERYASDGSSMQETM